MKIIETETNYNFVSPIGIAKSEEEGLFEMENMKPGFVVYNIKGNLEVEILLEKESLANAYFKIMDLFPDVVDVKVIIHEYW